MGKAERLLDLIAYLLDAKGPRSFAELRGAFPDEYAGSADSAERKFERDKAELLELGIPIDWTETEEESGGGYVIDRDAYYLPALGLTPEENAVLYAAGSAVLASGVFPGRQDLAHALRKIGFFAEGGLPTPKVRLELGSVADSGELPARLEALWSAIAAKKSVDLEYFSPANGELTRRTVNPYGLALRRGLWTLVGHCHLRQAVRAFHVHRIRSLKVNSTKPRSPDFTVPAEFRLEDWVATFPWQHRFHAPVPVELELTQDLAPIAGKLFATEPRAEGAAARVTVVATDLDGLLRYVLSLGAQARVLGPPDAVARARAMAEKLLAGHAAAGARA